jgi:ribosomal protein S18 acetylase RimI-like enzyme
MQIITAESEQHFATARALFQEYAASLGVDLCFQDFDTELATLERMYAAPGGRLLLALDGDAFAGCAAVRALSVEGARGTCEMKRLYVRPDYRGTGLGRRLAQEILQAGRALGYTRMVLDTLVTMDRARALYGVLGFRDIAAYYPNPLPGVRYMEADL